MPQLYWFTGLLVARGLHWREILCRNSVFEDHVILHTPLTLHTCIFPLFATCTSLSQFLFQLPALLLQNKNTHLEILACYPSSSAACISLKYRFSSSSEVLAVSVLVAVVYYPLPNFFRTAVNTTADSTVLHGLKHHWEGKAGKLPAGEASNVHTCHDQQLSWDPSDGRFCLSLSVWQTCLLYCCYLILREAFSKGESFRLIVAWVQLKGVLAFPYFWIILHLYLLSMMMGFVLLFICLEVAVF